MSDPVIRPSKTRTFAVWFMVAAVVVAIGIDLVLYFNDTPDDMFSQVLQDWGKQTAALPYAMAVLLGHFFIPNKRQFATWAQWGGLFAGLVLVAGLHWLTDREFPGPVEALLFGLFCGWFWWGQPEDY